MSNSIKDNFVLSYDYYSKIFGSCHNVGAGGVHGRLAATGLIYINNISNKRFLQSFNRRRRTIGLD